jgi:predicted RNA-binding Zn-ribbon protein involved in translation (DUF1610 family)
MDHIYNFKMIVLADKPKGGVLFSKDNLAESRKLEPFVAGKGALNYNCGKCGHNLLKSVLRMQVTDAVYKCPSCGSYNQIKA